ncbi:MAG TPA: FUSC family protein [Streptosporangiaceae bacterium]|nr:FUSC family protein [Streptosporangiaceae bacterium]
MTELGHMSSSAVAQSSGVRGATAATGPGQQGSPWWQVSWSKAAALRALRATIVIPALFALTYKVIGDAQMTLFAVFGGFATLVVAQFGGTRRDKAIAHLGLALAGSLVIVIGTLVSGSSWLATVVTIPVAFAVYFAGSAGPNAASGVTACLFAYVLPVATTAPLSAVPSRLEGWWLAAAAGTAAVLLLSPRSPGDQLRAQAANLAGLTADQLAAVVAGTPTQASRDAVQTAKRELMSSFTGTPYRPIGLATADRGLASLIHLLEGCASLVGDASDGHLELPASAIADRQLLELSAQVLHRIAAVLSGRADSIDLDPLWQARLASARHLQTVADDAAVAVRRADHAYHAQAIGIATSAAAGEALIAARLASPADVAAKRRNWFAGLSAPQQAAWADGEDDGEPPGAGLPERGIGAIATDASLRSVWFRNSARGAIALAAAVAVARFTDVQHAFWVVLGTLSVLRTSAAATGSTALRALLGTSIGFVIGAALLVGIGTSPTALWIAFPLAVLVAAYTPGTAPFAAGQAAFTVTIVVLYNVLVPAGWKVGLLRVEDVAIGCAVSLVVGFLFWPRGISSVVGDNLADAFRSGAGYLSDAANWALGDRAARPERADVALLARNRLDDALRGYLTEQGSKRLSKSDLWALVMGATRLELTAHSMASLPTTPHPHADDGKLHAALRRQMADLSDFYDQLAAEVSRPTRGTALPALLSLSASGIASVTVGPCGASPAYRADGLWVGHQLDHLQAHSADITGPAERLAAIRRRPWWR